MSTELNHSATPQLTTAQQELLKAAVRSAGRGNFLSTVERQSIKEIFQAFADLRRSPEQCLVAFKSYLAAAANDGGIPLGRERAMLLEGFVTLFIEEMYRVDSQGEPADLGHRGQTNGLTPAGNLDLPGAHP
jgi:hypothetical protein